MSDSEHDTGIPELATLDRWATAAAALMRGWEIDNAHWYLAEESVLLLQGYPVPPESAWADRFTLHLDPTQVGWEGDDQGLLAPPADHPARPALEAVVGSGVPLELLSTQVYSLPVTFLKTVTLADGTEAEMAAPRGLARVRTVDVLNRVQEGSEVGEAEATRLRAGAERARGLAQVPWPRRDRWFGKFWNELAEVYLRLADNDPPRPSQVRKFGRRWVVV